MYNTFMDVALQKVVSLSADLKEAMDELKALCKELEGVEDTGQSCRRQAKWIGLERSNEKNREMQLNVPMIETEKLKRWGLKSGALGEEDGDILFLGDDWHRMCAPEEDQSGKTYALIFWTKKHPDDQEPTWDKQVSGRC